ncbi:MAG TPA: T9SS C-terminal target domain-containing protein, partial [Flavobacteriaceae bacterium]|nr:T9SS C-terminal target domain-containing protein [Flavobacteriaceae bacterium]
ANIYFDFNPPILTNTVTTTIIENLGTENYAFNGFKLYPNPSKDLVNIKSTQSVMEIEITNQIGQVISQIKNKEGINTFSIENLPMGIYFVKLVDENSNSVVKKLLKK